MNRIKIVVLLIILMILQSFGEVYIRYNYLGYSPARQKRFVIMSDSDVKNASWELLRKNGSQTEVVQKGNLEKSVYGEGDHLPLKFNYILDFSDLAVEGNYELRVAGAQPALFPIKKDPYGKLIAEPLHWMRAARCGSNDAIDHALCRTGDTSCVIHHRANPMDNGSWAESNNGKNVDLAGGWHDAADYLKFSLTIGYATYFLLRSYDINPELFDTMKVYSKTEYNDLLDEAKWGLDWLMKCMPKVNGKVDTTEFCIMVSNSEDHNVGYRLPQDDELNGKRPILSALSAPQMGYTAASLALGAKIFKKNGKTALAKEYEEMARLVYRRAVSKDVAPMAALNDEVNVFYGDETKNDNLELAAAELYALTGEEYYKNEAIKYADLARSAGWKAWESVNMQAHMSIMDAYPVAKNDLYKDLDQFLENSRRKGNIWGIPMKYVWGGLYSYIGVGATALEYQVKSGDRRYEKLGRDMIDYLLGYNNWGICFVATQTLGEHVNSIRDPYSQVYNLQADKFPRGAISEGPGDRQSWEKFKHYFGFDTKAERTNKFNTRAGVFYDKRKDFMCMETTIAGVADGIYMLAVASKFFQE